MAELVAGLLTLGAFTLLSQDESLWQQLLDWWKSWQGQTVLQPVPVRVPRPRRLPR